MVRGRIVKHKQHSDLGSLLDRIEPYARDCGGRDTN
jgi:hypothetical protein